MAVNGIEIKKGQQWRRRDGTVRTIVQHKPDAGYPWVDTQGSTYTDGGRQRRHEEGRYDLVELFEDAPAPTPHVDEVPMPIPEPIIGNAKAYLLAEAPKAPDLLEAAAGHMRDRAATYDKPEGERSMAQTVAIFNLHHGAALTEAQGWHFMQILKDVRLFTNVDQPHRDSGEDGIAYSALKVEALLKGGAQ